MADEIERKFLVTDDSWRARVDHSVRQIQGYLGSVDTCSIRIRVEGDQANLNIKSATLGVSRREYDYSIPLDEAEEMLAQLCRKPLIEKTRHHIHAGKHTWEVDEFHGDNAGLIVAEIELVHPDEPFKRPDWLGEEVSHDTRYYNVCLVEHPYKEW
jgi:adenylate cyclase